MNKPQKIIIDGYNVIHADTRLSRLAGTDLNLARDELLGRLKKYLKSKSLHVTVVFDGRGGLTDTDAVLPEKLQVLYSAGGHTADNLILEVLRESRNPREFIVVSSDQADIGREAGAMGAQVITSAGFLERISHSRRPESNEPYEKPHPSQEDVEYWLDRFSDQVSGDGTDSD
jgi:predicted RNA-binding protein with PIN domain